jgi:hypothetical protein
MVMNSFGKRNFMQPMGRPKMQSKCLDFIFLISLGGGRGGCENFFLIFP